MNRFISLLAIFFVIACNNATSTKQDHMDSVPTTGDLADKPMVMPVVNPNEILPGKSIGKIYIGALPENVISVLGKPDASDAAMGKAWMTWNGDRDAHNNATALNVYVTYKDSTMDEKVVQQIRTTSSSFFTPGGIHVYASLDSIREKFPAIKNVAAYADTTRHFIIYDDVDAGIAFDIVDANGQNICTGITVHPVGKPVTGTYIYLHPGMKKVE